MFNWTTIYFVAAGIVVLAIALLISVGMYGRNRDRETLSDPYVEGLKSLLEGKKNAAFSMFQKSIKSGKAPVDAYIKMGELLREDGSPGKALQIHKSLTVKTDLGKKEKMELFINIARDYSKMGNSEQAVKILNAAAKNPGLKDPRLLPMLAREYHVLGNTEESYKCLKEMKRDGAAGDRELSLYLCTAGEQKEEEDKVKDALKLYKSALKQDSENPVAHLLLGNAEEKAGNEEEALANWKRAAILSPELSDEALRNLERVMFNRGTFGDIERVYRDVLEARPGDERATLALALFYKKQGRGDEAIDFLKEFRTVHDDSTGATMLLTSLYATQKERSELEEFLEENEAIVRKGTYICADCEFKSTTMRWHCPRCNSFDSFSPRHYEI